MTAMGMATAAQAQRAEQPLAKGWRFLKADAPDASQPQFDDSAWQQVQVPHSWNRVGYYLDSTGTGRNTAANVDKYQGVGWYRLSFDAPVDTVDSRHWLEFDAASRVAQVWLNGVYLGEHRGGFSRFRLNIAKALRPGVRNVLAVRVDNSRPTADSPTADILPLTGDFFVHGGLYRPVRLVTTAPLHLAMDDHGGPGFRATTLNIRNNIAHLRVSAQLRNDHAMPVGAKLRIRLIGRDGRVVASTLRNIKLNANADEVVSQDLTIARPHLWSGVADPYLYRLSITVLNAQGQITDTVERPFGIRTMRFDADHGFFLNDKPYQLHGVGYHQDVEGKGWAISPADVERDVAIMREMGVNSIRLTHYQHGQTIHDIADRVGLIVWNEIPLVSAWTQGNATDASPALVANARQQLQELIRQNANHASVATWGIANEVDFGNSLPLFLTGRTNGQTPDPIPLLQELNSLAHAEDPSRPTTLATCCEGRLFDATVQVPVVSQVTDLGGANRYFGWYFGAANDLGPQLDQLHATRPHQPLSVTEYGAGGAVTMHTDNVFGAPVDSRGRTQPEEYQSYIHETAWAAIKARPYLYASWLWNSFDFATTIRAEGDGQDINTKGLVTYDRAIRKDAWFFYKANWTTAPTVHINGRRYIDRAYQSNDVKIYSNARHTTLYLNGRSLGVRSACPNAVCEWKGVRLDVGKNSLRAVGQFANGRRAQDSATWQWDEERSRHYAIDAGTLVAAKGRTIGFGSDTFFTGGEARSADRPADYGRPAQAVPIAGSVERDAMATYRSGAFSYAIPVAAGQAKISLWFLSGPRPKGGTFDVVINGQTVMQAYDPAKEFEDLRAIQKTFAVTSNGTVRVTFKPVSGEAMVSAIEIDRR
ncbi:glycoside hydrolase family 2 TIM barrel-domain containing protein [Novosphingobium ovatum]|nr:glycoside hydrolase family 2 TIM barrel-domain containing protein [Novosphingobium ovatum]